MKKQIVLCADDYGQAPSISAGIRQLISQQRLSASSCMVNQPDWLAEAGALTPFQGQIDIGLHFNLTHGRPVSAAFRAAYGETFPTLGRLIMSAYLHRLDQSVILEECLAQLALFADGMGRQPDFIDGHQHVHQFPIIREAVLEAFQMRLNKARAYVRLPCEQVNWRRDGFAIRQRMISLLGQQALKRRLDALTIPYNRTFAGAYQFSQSRDYPSLFPRFLSRIEEGGLIMCHPGLPHGDSHDPIAAVRGAEYAYFASERFLVDCAAQHVHLKRFFG